MPEYAFAGDVEVVAVDKGKQRFRNCWKRAVPSTENWDFSLFASLLFLILFQEAAGGTMRVMQNFV